MPPTQQDLHKQLEAKISAFHGTEDTILYPSCFDANVSASGGLSRGFARNGRP